MLTDWMRMVLRRGASKYRGVSWDKRQSQWRVLPAHVSHAHSPIVPPVVLGCAATR